MNTQLGLAVVTASVLFTGMVGIVAAQTTQNNASGFNPRRMQLTPRKPPSTAPRNLSGPKEEGSGSAPATGTFTTFDAPGAVGVTYPYAINLEGVITGFYNDTSGVSHGFLRYGRRAQLIRRAWRFGRHLRLRH